MRRYLLPVILLLSIAGQAQDFLVTRKLDTIYCRIIALQGDSVVYSTPNNAGHSTMGRSNLLQLNYASGVEINIENTILAPNYDQAIPTTSDSMYHLGVKHARLYYTDYKAAGTGTLLTSFFVPYGLIPAIACSATPPNYSHMNVPNPKLLSDPNYYKGYRTEAHKIKRKKVWKNFAIGTGASVVAYSLGFIMLLAALGVE